MKGKGVSALFLLFGMAALYLAAFVAQAGASQQVPAVDEPPSPPPDPGSRPVLDSDPIVTVASGKSPSWTPLPVDEDLLVRLPGTQPDQGVVIVGPAQCDNCHAGYDPLTEPYNNWQGSMMAQAARDPLYWATVTVAAQDAIWAVGTPNATDFCLRCHMPGGWLGGRSDPTNGSAMTGIDFDGVQCNLCHYLYDPFFETTYAGTREGNDWLGYWDESNASPTPSNTAATALYNQDSSLAAAITKFNNTSFYSSNLPPAGFTENGAGQMFVSTLTDNRRASFADANANHPINYSRYHKSKYFCSTCHDISNPVIANLSADPTDALPTEISSAYSYYHVERTFSEFMLSDFGLQGGAAGIGPYDPDLFDTSRPNNAIATCQDCHMRDQAGKGADKNRAILRPDESVEHPQSGVPQHDLTGGNMWVSYILASAVSGSANYDAINDDLLNQGSAVLTMDLTSGEAFDPPSLLAGVTRAEQNLHDAAAIQAIDYSIASGELSFRVQNQTGHKLISGYPEGRRMYLNIRYYDGETLLLEVNPYDAAAGTLKGLTGTVYDDPDLIAPLPDPASLGANERYVDELVYEMHGSSSLTGEDETFHFALSDGRYKDNRIPPMGFRIDEASARLSEPVWHGNSALDYFNAAEYAGGYDEIDLEDYDLQVPGADKIEIALYYQTTSREYIEFLRNEINGEGQLTLSDPGYSGDPAYLIQSDPFFSQLKAWGDTIWQLWRHNMNLPGAAPVPMATSIYTPAVNNPPVAVGDRYTTTKNITLSVATPGVLINDSDSDGDPLTAELDNGPSNGTLSLDTDGSFVYTPTLDFSGTDYFDYHADDGLEDSNTVGVTIAVRASNTAPVAVSDKYTTTEDITLTIPADGVLENDSDPDGDPLSAVQVDNVTHGSLALESDGSFVYTPTLNFNGSDSFSYHANDGELDSNTLVVTLTVKPANDAPIAVADSFTTTEDITLFVPADGVLENDSDPDGDPLTAVLGLNVSHGSLALESDGSFVYTPTLNFNGADSFTYHAHDGLLDSNTVAVTLTVKPANDAPIAVPDIYTTTEDISLFVAEPGVLGNDIDFDGDGLTAVLGLNVSHGSLALESDGSFVYTPTLNFNGSDSFSYHAHDGLLDSNTVVVTLTVKPANDAPIAVADIFTTTEDITLFVPADGVLENDSDPDGDPLTAVLGLNVSHGSLALESDGSFVYTPTLNFNGADSFTYHAHDGLLDSNTVAVTLTVKPANDAPIAVPDIYTTTEDISLFVAEPGVLGNDIDFDGDGLTAVLGLNVSHGSLALESDGSFVYTPTLNFNGADSFTYHAHDGLLDSNTVVVTLTVKPANDAPIAVTDIYTTTEDITLFVPADGVLENDSDPDGDPLTAVLDVSPGQGALTLADDGSFVYTPTLNFNGSNSFTYHAHDGLLDSNTVVVTLTVRPANDAPIAVADIYTTTEDITLFVAEPGVLGNDIDFDGDILSAVVESHPVNGTFQLQADGSFVYTPTTNFNGQDSFTYFADDGMARSNLATVTLTVTPANDAPIAVNDRYTTTRNIRLVIPAPGVLVNDRDIDGDGLTAIVGSEPVSGTLWLEADGAFVYTPTLGFSGQDSFTYYAYDGTTLSNLATVMLIVTAVNDPPVAVSDKYTTTEDITLEVHTPGVLGNDHDPEGNPLTAILNTGPDHGQLILSLNGSFFYTPLLNFHGTDRFTYRANDGQLDSNTVVVTLTVTAANDAPIAVADIYTTTEDIILVVDPLGVLENDIDVDGDGLSAVLNDDVAHGALKLSLDGSFVYTPTKGYSGLDNFTYRAYDGKVYSEPATVRLTVEPRPMSTIYLPIVLKP